MDQPRFPLPRQDHWRHRGSVARSGYGREKHRSLSDAADRPLVKQKVQPKSMLVLGYRFSEQGQPRATLLSTGPPLRQPANREIRPPYCVIQTSEQTLI